jgi:multicomponent Na+:H+ antiporter subunit G
MMTEILETLLSWFHAVREPIGGVLLLAGGLLAIVGAVGLLRFPDVYTRLHATSVTDTGAGTLMIVGMILLSPTGWVALKLVFIWVFMFLANPTASHAIANAAYTAGVEPKIGPPGETGEAGS